MRCFPLSVASIQNKVRGLGKAAWINRIMLKLKTIKTEEGFTLVEILVSILITTTFVIVGMQALVIAAVFKIKAQETAEGTLWIQEDLENIRYQAFQLNGGSSAPSTAAECTPTTGNEEEGYADTLRDAVILTTPGDALTESDSFTKTSKFYDSKTYTVSREFTLSGNEPYNVLQIEYDVTDSDGETVASLYTEVIPDAAFQCP